MASGSASSRSPSRSNSCAGISAISNAASLTSPNAVGRGARSPREANESDRQLGARLLFVCDSRFGVETARSEYRKFASNICIQILQNPGEDRLSRVPCPETVTDLPGGCRNAGGQGCGATLPSESLQNRPRRGRGRIADIHQGALILHGCYPGHLDGIPSAWAGRMFQFI